MKKMMLSIFSILLTGAFLYGAVTVTDGNTSVSIDFNSTSSMQNTDQTSSDTQNNGESSPVSGLDQKKHNKRPEPAPPIVGTDGDI